jgi:regulator of telomere elongation helicase 1
MSNYQAQVDLIKQGITTGAVFFAVCRGKLAEGISLNDEYCRCVIMVGIPKSNITEPRTILKKRVCVHQHIKEYAKKNGGRSYFGADPGEKWYLREAVRAVNQGIGRVIRHKDDYGIIILVDKRY